MLWYNKTINWFKKKKAHQIENSIFVTYYYISLLHSIDHSIILYNDHCMNNNCWTKTVFITQHGQYLDSSFVYQDTIHSLNVRGFCWVSGVLSLCFEFYHKCLLRWQNLLKSFNLFLTAEWWIRYSFGFNISFFIN